MLAEFSLELNLGLLKGSRIALGIVRLRNDNKEKLILNFKLKCALLIKSDLHVTSAKHTSYKPTVCSFYARMSRLNFSAQNFSRCLHVALERATDAHLLCE